MGFHPTIGKECQLNSIRISPQGIDVNNFVLLYTFGKRNK